MLRRDTVSVIEKGKLLLRSRELFAAEHSQWMSWLAKNFDMSYRSAINYCHAAEYVARKSKFATVGKFRQRGTTVLYRLAEGGHTEQEEAEILAQAKAGQRVDRDLALAICETLAPPDDADEADDQDDDGSDDTEAASAEDRKIAAILDGPPPAVPPPADPPPRTDFVLRLFDEVISKLKLLMAKPVAQFAGSTHSANDLEAVESFLHAVTKAKATEVTS